MYCSACNLRQGFPTCDVVASVIIKGVSMFHVVFASLFVQVNIMDWVASGSFKGDMEILDKSGNGVGKIFLAVKFERPGRVRVRLGFMVRVLRTYMVFPFK